MRRLVKTRLMVSALLALAVLPAVAADYVTLEDECRGRQLLIRGVIEPGDYSRLVAAMAALVNGDLPAVQDPDKLWTVMLDSPGGDLDEAIRMGRFLRGAVAVTDAGYRFARRPDGVWDFARSDTTVCVQGEGRLAGCEPDLVEAECTGACLLVWLGGAARYADEGRLGVHGLAGEPGVRDYVQEMGMSAEQSDWLLGDVPSDGWLDWPQRHVLGRRLDELDEWLAGCPPPLSADESFRSVVSISAAERDRLMDRAEAHRVCRRERLAAARRGVMGNLQALAAAPLPSGAE